MMFLGWQYIRPLWGKLYLMKKFYRLKLRYFEREKRRSVKNIEYVLIVTLTLKNLIKDNEIVFYVLAYIQFTRGTYK